MAGAARSGCSFKKDMSFNFSEFAGLPVNRFLGCFPANRPTGQQITG